MESGPRELGAASAPSQRDLVLSRGEPDSADSEQQDADASRVASRGDGSCLAPGFEPGETRLGPDLGPLVNVPLSLRCRVTAATENGEGRRPGPWAWGSRAPQGRRPPSPCLDGDGLPGRPSRWAGPTPVVASAQRTSPQGTGTRPEASSCVPCLRGQGAKWRPCLFSEVLSRCPDRLAPRPPARPPALVPPVIS